MFLILFTNNKLVFFTCVIVMLSRFIYSGIRGFQEMEKFREVNEEDPESGQGRKSMIFVAQLGQFIVPIIGICCVAYLFFMRSELWR